MTMKTNRIPLAIALSSVMAFAVGCSNDRDADGRADTTTTSDPAMQTPPPVGTDTTGTGTTGTAGTGGVMDGSGTGTGMNDGMDSDQPGTDTWITTKVKSSLLADPDVAGLDIEVDTVNGVVTLNGVVDEQTQVIEATRIAREIEGVTDVRTEGLTTGTANQ
ncbi:BON domain-containing protein [Luteimonas sp. 100069]|uniref:BON domain-containing protein n=1 Tax=Luteimonas sp. 100069 TaxID=2006109 RepID=UPI001F1DB0CA|nr:BON domain-containing protein [Luteimonas sp. 100069]